jgi:uncharacterized protein (DUF1330 family)
MAAYVIADITVTDPAQYDAYVQQAVPTLEPYGAKILAYQDNPELIEGDWTPKRIAIIEFKDVDTAKEWYYSSAYKTARELRISAGIVKAVLAPAR